MSLAGRAGDAALPAAAQKVFPAFWAASSEQKEVKKMWCPNCGHEFNGVVCPHCGRSSAARRYCPRCGSQAAGNYCSFCGARIPSSGEPPLGDSSDKNRWIAFFLCLFLGGLGIHRFYTGKVGTGILWALLFVLLPGIGILAVLVDLVFIVMGKFRDKAGRYLR